MTWLAKPSACVRAPLAMEECVAIKGEECMHRAGRENGRREREETKLKRECE